MTRVILFTTLNLRNNWFYLESNSFSLYFIYNFIFFLLWFTFHTRIYLTAMFVSIFHTVFRMKNGHFQSERKIPGAGGFLFCATFTAFFATSCLVLCAAFTLLQLISIYFSVFFCVHCRSILLILFKCFFVKWRDRVWSRFISKE